VPFRVVAAAALSDWREAERQLAANPEGSPAWHEATIAAADAKARYLQAIEDARAAHTPEPAPFDEASAQT
jgi:hypothetical protein